MRPKALERYSFFPYMAWTVVICFALYTCNLALMLQSTLSDLENDCIERNICAE